MIKCHKRGTNEAQISPSDLLPQTAWLRKSLGVTVSPPSFPSKWEVPPHPRNSPLIDLKHRVSPRTKCPTGSFSSTKILPLSSGPQIHGFGIRNESISQGREQLGLEDSPIQNDSPSHMGRKIPKASRIQPTPSASGSWLSRPFPDTHTSPHPSHRQPFLRP